VIYEPFATDTRRWVWSQLTNYWINGLDRQVLSQLLLQTGNINAFWLRGWVGGRLLPLTPAVVLSNVSPKL